MTSPSVRDQGLPNYQDLPLGVAGMIERKGKPIHLVLARLQELPEGVTVINQPPNGVTTPDFLLGLT